MVAEGTEGNGEVEDGPAARAARDDIVREVGQLAAKPLDEPAGERLRRALAAAPATRVRGALRRFAGTDRSGGGPAAADGEQLCVLTWPGLGQTCAGGAA